MGFLGTHVGGCTCSMLRQVCAYVQSHVIVASMLRERLQCCICVAAWLLFSWNLYTPCENRKQNRNSITSNLQRAEYIIVARNAD